MSWAYGSASHGTANIGTASAQVVAAKANRKNLVVTNDGTAVVYLAFGKAAVMNEGIRLAANGGSYEMSQNTGNLWSGLINGIAGVACKVIYVEGS